MRIIDTLSGVLLILLVPTVAGGAIALPKRQLGLGANANATLGVGVDGVIDTSVAGFVGIEGTIDLPPGKANHAGMNFVNMWRDLQYSVKSQQVRVRSRLQNHSDYTFKVSIDGRHPRIRVFLHEKNNDTDATFTQTYMISFVRVVEANDTIPWQNSTSSIDLISRNGNNPWRSFRASSYNVNSTTILSANTTFADPTQSGFEMTISTFVAQNAVPMPEADGTFRPNAIKYSIGMSKFPFKFQNSHLVIVQAVSSNQKLTFGSDGKSLVIGEKTGSALSWNNTIAYKSTQASTYAAAQVNVETTLAAPAQGDADLLTSADPAAEKKEGEKATLVAYHILTTDATKESEWLWDPEAAVGTASTGNGVRGTSFGMGVGLAVVAAVLMMLV